jgi:hypothetical protein
LKEDVPTLDFSGFAVYTHENVPDSVVTSICSALEARKEKIPWQEEGPFPLDRMCRDTPEGPLNIPLHPAAERFLARTRLPHLKFWNLEWYESFPQGRPYVAISPAARKSSLLT